MPPTARSVNNDLSIDLVNPSTPLFPGSVILGHVVRRTTIDAPSSVIRVRLQGRAKAKLVADNGNGNTTYRSRFNFWNESDVAETVHEGNLSIASGQDLSRPFSLTIPTDTSAKAVNAGRSEKEKQASFIKSPGTGSKEIPEQPLPGTYRVDHSSFSKKWHGYVEFWIEAELAVRSGRGKTKVTKAKLPIRINGARTRPITDFGLASRKMPGCVSSDLLVPGTDRADLSFKQKMRKVFGSSKVPGFHYKLEVTYPTVVQLGNPASVPFLLRLLPDWEKTSDVLSGVRQLVTVAKAEVQVETTSSVICPGTFDSHEGSKSSKVLLGSQVASVKRAKGETVLSCDPAAKAVDIGAELGMRMEISSSIVPTQVTYCLKTEHMMSWEIGVLIGGETWACSGRQRLVVLPPSQVPDADGTGGTLGEEELGLLGALEVGVEATSVALDVYEVITALSEL
ncbi:hypothetical protein C8035_v002065 [Colletotrichum spinosum]|uniref:Arrestin-like N-terminal domain-containing protein n=1 Tax=Colletotrichum spinosum TaxID=1347390 RepID=A0A4R8PXJ5_9PEZI|nr:hypothetical protein C8035_v002065 [Colletotrichum spinosum]